MRTGTRIDQHGLAVHLDVAVIIIRDTMDDDALRQGGADHDIAAQPNGVDWVLRDVGADFSRWSDGIDLFDRADQLRRPVRETLPVVVESVSV